MIIVVGKDGIILSLSAGWTLKSSKVKSDPGEVGEVLDQQPELGLRPEPERTFTNIISWYRPTVDTFVLHRQYRP